MSQFRVIKHSVNCKYIFDTYRVWDVTSEQQAIDKLKVLTGVTGDYALKGSGAFDVGIIDTLDF